MQHYTLILMYGTMSRFKRPSASKWKTWLVYLVWKDAHILLVSNRLSYPYQDIIDFRLNKHSIITVHPLTSHKPVCFSVGKLDPWLLRVSPHKNLPILLILLETRLVRNTTCFVLKYSVLVFQCTSETHNSVPYSHQRNSSRPSPLKAYVLHITLHRSDADACCDSNTEFCCCI